jgi:hypothetical protein
VEGMHLYYLTNAGPTVIVSMVHAKRTAVNQVASDAKSEFGL